MANFALGELLSPIDFEYLVRDLLSKDLSIELTAFAEGKDGGIDLRHSKTLDSNDVIVQCKRTKALSKETLINEKAKVQSLNPDKYYIATSSNVSVKKSEFILNTFSDWMENESNIYDKSRLNNLLDQNKDILRKHYKLWVNSSELFNEFINQSLIERSKSFFKTVKEDSKYFVKGESYNEAVEILNKNNFLIISGNPGIGKSTLAKILLIEYAQKDYEVLKITNIAEGEQFLQENSIDKQVYYFDDFLGENFLQSDVLGGRSNDLVEFIKRFNKKGSNKKLILTTREYILQQAKERYEKLNDDDLDIAKHILDLAKYSEKIKAFILYNHLVYSGIKKKFIKELLKGNTYKKIINHRGYNPRIIERMTVKLRDVAVENYKSEFLNHLEKPYIIWDRAFDNQISDGAKSLLFVLLTFDGPVVKTELEIAFKKFINCENAIHKGNGAQFNRYIKEIEDSFVQSKASDNNSHIILNFQNPSVKDFLIDLLIANTDVVRQLLSSIVFWDQFKYLINLISKEFSTDSFLSELLIDVALAADKLKVNLWVLSSGTVFPMSRSPIERLQVCNRIPNILDNKKYRSFFISQLESTSIEDISQSDVKIYLGLLNLAKEETKIDKYTLVEKLFHGANGARGISNFLRAFRYLKNEFNAFVSSNQDEIEETIHQTLMESIENAEDTNDIGNLEECYSEFNHISINGLNFYSDRVHLNRLISDKNDELQSSLSHSQDFENLDDFDPSKDARDFSVDDLFKIENF